MRRRDDRGSLHILRNIALSLKDEEGFAAFADFHSIINLISIDKKVDLRKRVCKTGKCEEIPSSRKGGGGRICRSGHEMENMLNPRSPARRR